MTESNAAFVDATFQRALMLHQQSRLNEAHGLYQQTLQAEPRHFPSLHMLGVIALQAGRPHDAASLFARALEIAPNSAASYVNYGTALQELGRFTDAVESFDKALALDPGCAEAHLNRGNALHALLQHEAAIDSFDRALEIKPGYRDAYLNRGLALSTLRRHEAAVSSYDDAIRIDPSYADPYYNRGNELHILGRYVAALGSYDKAISLQPGYANAHLNRGNALIRLRRYSDALASFDRAIVLRPDHAPSHCNRAGALQHLGRYSDALLSYDRAVALRPEDAVAYANRGRALRELRRYPAAIADYDKAMALDAGSADLHVIRRQLKMQICDWAGYEFDVSKISADIRAQTIAPNPFYVLTLVDSAELQRLAAENWVRKEHPPSPYLGQFPRRSSNSPIRLGYFSADFHEHATSYLIAQLLELHDRSRFRVMGISFGPDSRGPMRQRIESACDEFIEVRERSDHDIAELARERGIDIGIDLKGYTQDHRAGIFAQRAAPIQINYLGYPGTMGAPYMDYVVADRVIAPLDESANLTERIIRLPHSYQVNDTRRAIADRKFTRAEVGLPPSGFVFCCFNNSYKIAPAIFDRWMSILSRVDGSVLLLLEDNVTAKQNLRREAEHRGVAQDRLIFVGRVDLPLHLARHRVADLFIDTLPCNAHTTASDALWAGLPVLTCRGESMAARVAASLLTAMALPELIAGSPEQYEEMAVRLAGEPELLAGFRQRLEEHRLSAPLFDTPRYARHLEEAFSTVYQRYQAGLPPGHVEIRPDRA